MPLYCISVVVNLEEIVVYANGARRCSVSAKELQINLGKGGEDIVPPHLRKESTVDIETTADLLQCIGKKVSEEEEGSISWAQAK